MTSKSMQGKPMDELMGDNPNQYKPESPEYLIMEQAKTIIALRADAERFARFMTDTVGGDVTMQAEIDNLLDQHNALIKQLGEALEQADWIHDEDCQCQDVIEQGGEPVFKRCSCGADKAITAYREWKGKQK